MARKAYKTVQQENGSLSIFGNNHWIEIEYARPEWSEEEEACFKYKDNTYFLSDIMRVDKKTCPTWLEEFDGYRPDSYFSGIVIKLADSGDCLKAYTYY